MTRPRSSLPVLFVLACALCGLCLLGAACNGDGNDAPPPQHADFAPTDVFSRRAPKPARTATARKLLVVGDSLDQYVVQWQIFQF